MKKIYILLSTVMCLLFLSNISYAVSVTVTNPTNATPALAASYTTLANAITALNSITSVSGPIVLTCGSGGTETTPAGGFTINYNATGLSATNNIILDGNGSTITAFTPQASGILHDAIFEVLGSDFLTIQGFTMLENASNTTTAAATNNMTEWGVALLYLTTTNGAQNCTIKNNTIDLNRTYQNSFGIYSNSTHTSTAIATSATATSVAGSNSGITIIGNTITDVNNGITIVGPTGAANQNNGIVIGGTVANANTLSNYGTTGTFSGYANVSGTVNGILVRNSYNIDISNNNITSSNGGTTGGTLRGIFIPSFSSISTATSTNRINMNSISIRSGNATGTMNNLLVEATTFSNSSSLNIDSNNIHTTTHTVAASGNITFISTAIPVSSCSINYNTFNNLSVNTTGSVVFIFHSYTLPSLGTLNINYNSIVTGFSKTGAGGTNYFTSSAGSSPNNSICNIIGNNLSNITLTGGTNFVGFQNTDGFGSAPVKNISNNRFSNWLTGAGTFTCMNFLYWNGASTISFDTITNINAQGAITAINIGASYNNANPLIINNNIIQGLKATGAGGAVIGIANSNTSTQIDINNNLLDTLQNSTAASTNIFGINITGATKVNIFNNIVRNLYLTGASSVAPNITGIRVTAGVNDSIYNNVIFNYSALGTSSTGVITRGIHCTNPTLPFVYNNNIYALSTGSSNGASTELIGIGIQGVTTGSAVINNMISDLTTPNASNANALKAIELTSNSVVHNVFYNTIRLSGLSSTGAVFGGAGIQYPNSNLGVVSLRNNIINIDNATASSTGLIACVRRANILGPAGTKPGNLQADNNIYYINPSASNFLYVEGIDNTTCINGYGSSALTIDFTRKIFNDASFNTGCGLYKSFMKTGTPHEQNTFTENNLSSLLTVPPTFSPSGTSYAENSAQTGLTPNIIHDYNYVNRTPTNDRGALQFNGNGIDASAPIISYTNLKNPVCTNNQILTAIIKDFNGRVATGAGVKPRMYYKRNLNLDSFNVAINNNTFDGWKYVEGVQLNASDTLWKFTMDYSLLDGGAVVAGDSFKYFIIAQDTATPTVNIGTNTINFPAIYCPVSVAIDNFAAFPTFSIGTTGAKQDTIKALPNPITVSATNTTLCISGNSLLTSSLFIAGLKVDSVYWQESTDSISFTDISNSNKDTLTQSLTGTSKYFRQVIMCGGSPVDTSDIIKIQVNNPLILTTLLDTICGLGYDTLGVTFSGADSIWWYNTSVGGSILGRGNSFTTPLINKDSTFYVQAVVSSGSANATIGTNVTLSGATVEPAAFVNRWAGYKMQTIYRASELIAAGMTAGNINSMAFEINTNGDASNITFDTIRIKTTTNTNTTTTFETGTFTTVFVSNSYSYNAPGWQVRTFSTPFYWDGVSNIIIEDKHQGVDITNNSQTYYSTTSYNSVVHTSSSTANTALSATTGTVSTNRLNTRFAYTPLCVSPRVAVLASVTTPPAISVSAPTFVCVGQSASLNVTSPNDPNYIYTWNPGSLNGALQSVTPGSTTTYVLNALDTITGCVTSDDTVVQVRPYPTKPILNVDSVYVCPNTIQILNVTNPSYITNVSSTSSGAMILPFNDNSATAVTSTINVPALLGSVLVDSVAVTVSIRTSFVGDVELNLEAPNGQIVNLIADNGGLDVNYINTRISSNNTNPLLPTASGSGQAPFSSTYRATAATTGLIATSNLPTTTLFSNLLSTPNGIWRLRCYDDANGDIDTLTNWSIQIYYRTPANYNWTPTASLYTNAPATIGYTTGDSLSLYAKDTVNTSYIVTATLSGCSTSDTAKYEIKSGSSSVTLFNSTTNASPLIQDCEEGSWTYYADPSNNNKWLFAIDWDTNLVAKTNAQIQLTYNTAGITSDVKQRPGSSADYDGSYIMNRYWNVNNASLNPGSTPVKIRYFYDPTDITNATNMMNDSMLKYQALSPGGNTYYSTGWKWFKTVGIPFSPALINDGNNFSFAYVDLNPTTTGTINGVTYVQFDTITSFSGGSGGIGFTPHAGVGLPVSLLNFKGDVKEAYNYITWTTASEINNHHFELESSVDGISFSKIATIAGHGTTTTTNYYSFNDYKYNMPATYYRLKQVDNDGKETTTNMIILTRKSSANIDAVISIYPNPTKEITTLSIDVQENTDAVYTIYDVTGKIVSQGNVTCNVGINNTPIQTNQLSDGVYVVDVLINGKHINSRIVKTSN